jgi:hypothetical protein
LLLLLLSSSSSLLIGLRRELSQTQMSLC